MANKKSKFKAGDKFTDGISETRVMAVAEGYVMARFKGAAPYVISEKDFSIIVQNIKDRTPKEHGDDERLQNFYTPC